MEPLALKGLDTLVVVVLAKAQAVNTAITELAVAQEELSLALKSNIAVYEHVNTVLSSTPAVAPVVPNA
jgi:hypothetical protein